MTYAQKSGTTQFPWTHLQLHTPKFPGEFWEKASPGPGKSLSDCCIPDMSSPNTIPTICNGSINENRTQDFDLVDIG